MNTEKTGGLAFPNVYEDAFKETLVITDGMTLLDYFAAKAMNGALSGDISNDALQDKDLIIIAETSYKLAAAMIEERKKYINQ